MSAILQFGYDDAAVRSGLDGLANRLSRAKVAADKDLTLTASISSQSLSGLGSSLQNALSFGGVAGLSAILGGVVNDIGALSDEAAKLNELPSVLDRVGTVAADSSIGVDDISNAFLKLEKNLASVDDASSPVSQALQRLGLDAEQLAGLSLDDKLIAFADAFSENRDKGTAVADIFTLLGKGATTLIPLFEQGGDSLRGMFADVNGLADGTIERIDSLGDKVGRLTKSLSNFAGEAIDAVGELPGLLDDIGRGFVTDGFDGIDEALRKRGAAEQEADAARNAKLKERKGLAKEIAALEGSEGDSGTGKGTGGTKASSAARDAEKEAKDDETRLRNIGRALDQAQGRKIDLLPDEAQLAALKEDLTNIFQDVQLGGKAVTDTAGLEALIKTQLASGNTKGAEINANRLNDILALQQRIEGLSTKITGAATKAVDADAAAIEDAFDEIVAGWIEVDKAAEDAAKNEQRRADAVGSIAERIAILDAEAAGNDKLATSLREQAELRQRIAGLVGAGVDPQQAADLAQREQVAEQRKAAQDEQDSGRGERRRIRGGVSGTAENEAKINRVGSLDQFYRDQDTPLRDTFKFPGLDAFAANQPGNGRSLLRAQNAANNAAQTPKPGGLSLNEAPRMIELLDAISTKLNIAN